MLLLRNRPFLPICRFTGTRVMTRNIRKKKKGKENNFNNSCNENELVQIVAMDDNNLNCNN